MTRAGIVLCSEHGVAAIERIRDSLTYHTLPGGQVDEGESTEEAAKREAYEELGLKVKLHGLVAVVRFGPSTQFYYLAELVSGEFGSGTGEEMASPADSPAGSYRAVWIHPSQLVVQDLRPKSIAAALHEAADPGELLGRWLAAPVSFTERRG